MTQQSTNTSFHRQTNQIERGTNVADANSVEFLTGTAPNLATNPKRIWIDQATEQIKYTVDGSTIHEVTSSGNLGIINVKSPPFNAVGNGTTDDLTSINNAITYANSIKTSTNIPILYFPPATGYSVSGSVTIPSGISVIMESPIIYTGGLNVAAISVGTTGVSNKNVNLKLNATRSTVSDWTDENSIGIKIINSSTSEIEVMQAFGFTIGVQCIGSAQGFTYNNVYFGYIVNNKYAIDLTNESNGFCNENLFFNGRLSNTTGVHVGEARYGVRITSKDGLYTNNNNNCFYKPSFELRSTQSSPAEAVPVLVVQGSQNHFYDCRNEENSATLLRSLNASSQNSIETGYEVAVSTIDDQSTFPSTRYRSSLKPFITDQVVPIFDSGAMHLNACYYNGSTSVNIPNVQLELQSGGGSVVNNATNVTINANSIEIAGARGISVFVDTINCKRFILRHDADAGFGGRLSIRCYNAAGTILTSADSGHPFVKSYPDTTFTFGGTSFGGSYRNGTDQNDSFYFEVGAAVATIAVILNGGTQNMRVRSFQIHSLDGSSCAVWTGYEQQVPGGNLGTSAPTVGTWARGRRIWNDTPTAGGTEGFICVTAGTPGTWKTFGSIAP